MSDETLDHHSHTFVDSVVDGLRDNRRTDTATYADARAYRDTHPHRHTYAHTRPNVHANSHAYTHAHADTANNAVTDGDAAANSDATTGCAYHRRWYRLGAAIHANDGTASCLAHSAQHLHWLE
jgi:hypothetical protein